MKPMNDLLADIVVASGGTVTSNTRNGLLGDWLDAVSSPSLSPAITLNPASQSVDEYGNVTFTGAATGDEPITYQWYKNGSPVGTNSTSYTLTAAAADNGATVYFTATNSTGEATSSTATLTVTSYGYNFDGSTQYAQLSETVILPAIQSFSIEVTGKFSSSGFYICAVNGTQEYRFSILSSGGVFIPSTSIGTLSTTLWNRLKDGSLHTLKIERVGTTYTAYVDELSQVLTTSGVTDQMRFNSFCVHWGTSSPSFTGVFCRFIAKSNGVTLLDMPLNKKSLGATQTANSSAITATIQNYSAARWVAI